MKAKISFEVELEDVVKETHRLIISIINKFNLSQSILDVSDILEKDGNISKAIDGIDKIRQELMKVDVRLNDCSDILIGYQKALVSNIQQTKEENKE